MYLLILAAVAAPSMPAQLALQEATPRSCFHRPSPPTLQVQMMGGSQSLRLGPSDPETFHPDLDWLQQQLEGPQPPKLVYLVNPGNPTGIAADAQKRQLPRAAGHSNGLRCHC